MTIALTQIGNNSNTSGATVTVTGVTVPAGATIVGIAMEYAGAGNTVIGNFSDTLNTYHQIGTGVNPNNVTTNGKAGIHYAYNATALTGGTITYTKGASGVNTTISLFYITGLTTTDPLDTAVTATAFGTGAAPSVTSGVPAVAGELIVGAVCWHGATTDTFTQDSTHGAYATPPVFYAGVTGAQEAGGSVINAGTAALTYGPTITSNAWAAFVIGLKAAPPTAGWALTDLTSATSGAGATAALTGLSIPPGSLIVVGVDDGSNAASGGSCTDSAGNTYTSIVAKADGAGGTGNHGFSQLFYFNNNATTVTSITYTKVTSGANAVIAALYATGGAASAILDSAVTASAQGGGGTPSVTSGTPSVSGELLVGWIGWDVVQTFTQDTTHGWNTVGGLAATATASAGTGATAKGAGGNQVAGASPIIFSPTLTASPDWSALVAGFKAAPVGASIFQTSMMAMF